MGRKYARIFVLGHYLFLVAHSFPRASLSENCSLLGTDNVRGQISEHIYLPNGDYCLYNRTVDLASDWLIANLGTVVWISRLPRGSSPSQYRCDAFSRRKLKRVRRVNDEYAAGELLGKLDRILGSKPQWPALHPGGNSCTLNRFRCRKKA